jgi:cell division protease FtsH
VALLDEHCDPVHKVTIIPRGMALGLTQTLPEEDRYNLTKDQILSQIKHAMGGRAAEDLVFNHFSTGASNDLQQATHAARRMVCKFGMSEKLGPVSYGDDEQDVFLGRDFVSRKDYSEKKSQEIDDEVTAILSERYDSARQTLVDHRQVLDAIAEALLERETLSAEDLRRLVAGEPLPPIPVPEIAESEEPRPPRKSKAPRPAKEFPGDKLPDPEPAAG